MTTEGKKTGWELNPSCPPNRGPCQCILSYCTHTSFWNSSMLNQNRVLWSLLLPPVETFWVYTMRTSMSTVCLFQQSIVTTIVALYSIFLSQHSWNALFLASLSSTGIVQCFNSFISFQELLQIFRLHARLYQAFQTKHTLPAPRHPSAFPQSSTSFRDCEEHCRGALTPQQCTLSGN